MATQSISPNTTISSEPTSEAWWRFSDGSTSDRIARAVGGPLARTLLGLPMIVFGIFHFANTQAMAGAVPSWLPGASAWVVLTGVALVAAGLALITNRFARLAGLGLALLMVTFILTVHLPGLANDQTAQYATFSLLKDAAIAGGALLLTARG